MYDKDIRELLRSRVTYSLEEFCCTIWDSVIFDFYDFKKEIAYEIKSTQDTLTRLPNQLKIYDKYFNEYYVITDCKVKLEKLKSMDLLRAGLKFVKNSKITTIKKAQCKYVPLDTFNKWEILSKILITRNDRHRELIRKEADLISQKMYWKLKK